MRERPIIFSAPMVRAILSGAKTQTRRIVNRFTDFRRVTEFQRSRTPGADLSCRDSHLRWHDMKAAEVLGRGPFGQPGDRLWVRETWRVGAWDESTCCVATDYKADGYCRREWLRVDDEDLFTRLRQQCIDDARAALGPADRYTWEPGRSPCRWRPSIHMPRWASRITLEITDVRVERLQDIGEADAIAEGCRPVRPEIVMDGTVARVGRSAVDEYRQLWQSIHGPSSWDADPWVWVIEFKKLEQQEQA